MPAWVRYSLIAGAAVVGAVLGIAVAGPLGAVVAVVPPTLVAVWEAVQDDRRNAELQRDVARTHRMASTYDFVDPDDPGSK